MSGEHAVASVPAIGAAVAREAVSVVRSGEAPLRVLFVCYHFPPAQVSGALRAARFVRWLPSEIEVEVLTLADPREPAEDRPPAAAIPDRVRVHTAPERAWGARGDRVGDPGREPRVLASHATRRGVEALLRHLVWVPDRHVGWIPAARRRAGELVASGRFDVVFCSSPPHSAQLVGRDLKRRFGIPLVADFRDPWTDLRMPSWRQRRFDTPLHRGLERRMERSVLRAADAVIANTPSNREALLASFPELDPARVHCIPNGYDPGRPRAIARAREQAVRRTEGGGAPARRCLLYTGELYDGSERCLEALGLLLARDPSLSGRLELRLVGSLGPAAARVAARLERAGILTLAPRVPWDEVPAELAAADALLYAVPATSAHWIPSKLYDYLVAGRPILAVAPRGDAWEILERSGLATLVEDTGLEDVAGGMRRCLESLLAGTLAVEPRGEWIARFDGARQAQELASLLRRVAGRR
jgi:hypothetical protein